MKDFKYLIVGGGMTADAAVGGIRERDRDGTIAVLSNEKHPPYNRPCRRNYGPANRWNRSGRSTHQLKLSCFWIFT